MNWEPIWELRVQEGIKPYIRITIWLGEFWLMVVRLVPGVMLKLGRKCWSLFWVW